MAIPIPLALPNSDLTPPEAADDVAGEVPLMVRLSEPGSNTKQALCGAVSMNPGSRSTVKSAYEL